MKRLVQMLVFTITFAFTLTFAWLSYAGISNTVHNMSISAPPSATIKATTETEICVFCHIPHHAQAGRPLWNHDMPTTGYTMYTSEYLHRAGYQVPTALGTTTGTPGMLSRQCLSCHDGTVAVGAVYMVRGTILGDGLIAMSGVTATGTMPTAAVGYIGTNLTKHHPVGIEYNAAITISFGSGSRTIELISSPTSTDMKLYTISATYYVECSSCHDPHLQNTKFLRDTDGATFAAKISNTCSACHIKTGWSGSIHQTSALAYSDAGVSATFGTGTISSLVCMNCHRTHKGLGTPYLLRQAEETTCFQGASGVTTETACHGSSASAATNNIQTVLTQAYKHPTTTIQGIHTNLDVKYGTGVTRVPTGSKGLSWLAEDRHAECVDCHNPHRANNTPARVGTASWYPTTVDNTSNQTAKSGALLNVTGVKPSSWPAKWTVPTTFTTIESSTYEYEICFKCHSYWALNDGDGITTYTTASGQTVTDQAMEFNPNNYSAHPVVVGLNSQTGSPTPRALASTQMSSPWTTVGTQTMYCSDCHGADNESTGAKGPHGSARKYMLKGTRQYWTAGSGGILFSLNDLTNNNKGVAPYNVLNTNWRNELFCLNCHPMGSPSTGSITTFYNKAHDEHEDRDYTPFGSTKHNVYCVACHSVIPHGMKRSRMQVYDNRNTKYGTDVEPYRYVSGGVTYAAISGFKKPTTTPSRNAYNKDHCWSTVSGCTTHDDSGGYETN